MAENSGGGVNQAVILAGGKATRMRPYTDDRPKAMVEIASKPILEHQIRWLADNKVHYIVVSCGYKAEVIQDHFGDGSFLGADITYAHEAAPLGRGGGLKFAAGKLAHPGERWLGLNGDVLCDFPIHQMVDQHKQTGVAATIALAQYQTSWGIADLDGDLIKGFVQSPKLPYWINGGIYCFEPGVTALLPDKGDHEDTTFPELAKQAKLGGYKIEGYWRGIDTAKDIIEASDEIVNKKV
ncbi:MAG: nucleotidyltransferase family protein [Actinomycetota bacterium]